MSEHTAEQDFAKKGNNQEIINAITIPVNNGNITIVNVNGNNNIINLLSERWAAWNTFWTTLVPAINTSDDYIYNSILKHIAVENTSESEHRSAVNNGIIIIFNGNNNTIKFSEDIDR